MRTRKNLGKRLMSFTLALGMILGLFAGVTPYSAFAEAPPETAPDKIKIKSTYRPNSDFKYLSTQLGEEVYGGMFRAENATNPNEVIIAFCSEYYKKISFQEGSNIHTKDGVATEVNSVVRSLMASVSKLQYDLEYFSYANETRKNEFEVDVNVDGPHKGAQNPAMSNGASWIDTQEKLDKWKQDTGYELLRKRAAMVQSAVWLDEAGLLKSSDGVEKIYRIISDEVAQMLGNPTGDYTNIIRSINTSTQLGKTELYKYNSGNAAYQNTLIALYTPAGIPEESVLSLTITKKDPNNVTLNGARFSISGKVWNNLTSKYDLSWSGNAYYSNYQLNGTLTLSSEDKDTPALVEGVYTITELEAPPGGYLKDPTPQEVWILEGGDEKAYIEFINTKNPPIPVTPTVGIKKIDFNTKQGVAGAVIEIKSLKLDPIIEPITEMVTNPDTEETTEVITGYKKIERKHFGPVQFITGANGTISMEELIAKGFEVGAYGIYQATEITPPPGYLSVEEMQQFPEFKNLKKSYEMEYSENNQELSAIFQNVKRSDLSVYKVDNNNRGIGNVTFDVSRKNNGIIEPLGQFTTMADGKIDIPNLQPGTYVFEEINAPDEFIRLTKPIKIEIKFGENKVYSIKNDRKPSITIKKVSQDGNNLGGAHFKLEYFGEEKNGNPEIIFADKVTNGNGEILTEKLMPGWYKITEIQAPNGYQILEPNYREIYIRPNENATFTFENFNKPGVLIKKVDQYGKPVDGALFRMEYFGKDGNSGVVQTWDNLKAVDGVFFMGELPIGVYVITETKAPNGYALASPNSAKVTISDGNKEKVYVVTFVNDKTPELKITKIDANDSTKRLKDATFKFEYLGNDTNPNPIGELNYIETTNENGEIIIPHTGMKFGWWQITEIQAPPNYELDEELPFLFHVNPGMEEVLELKFKNKEKSNLEIFKADEETNQPVPNTTFDIYYRKSDADGWKDFKKNVKTDGTGILKYEHLDSGYYKIVEIKAADGYTLSNPNFQEIYIEAGKGTYEVRFDNQRKPDLTIVKIDPLNEKRIDGVKFEVSFSADGTNYGNPKTYVTNKDGKIIINKLDVGNYKITEIGTPVGYKVIKENSKYITLKPMESEMLIFENMPLSSIRVLKYDEKTGKPLPGATFKLTKADGTFIAEQETQADGIAVFNNLDAGDYEVTETKAPEGYGFSKVVTQKVKINYEDKLDQLIKFVKFGNESNVSLQLIKVCATDNSVVLQGAEFEITYADGKSVGDRFYTTDIDGRILIPDLERGTTIVIKETKAPKGFELDTNTKVVVLNEDINTVKFENKPHGKLIVNKYDSDTTGGKIALEGAEFKLMTAAGCEVGLDGNISNATVTTNGRFVTDSNGTFTVTGLKPGAYKLIETKAPNGYQIDKEEITFVINDKGDTQIIDVFNTKLNNLIIVKVDAETNQPLSGAEFKITTSDGKVVDQAGGKISSNGIYTTDNNGQIVITDLKPDTYVITEIKAPEGYILNDKPVTVKVNEDDTQTIKIPNTKIGGLIIEKVDSKTGERLSGAEFEVTKMNGERVGKYTTNSNGTITIPDIESGWYEIKEITSPYGYLLNEEIHKVEVKDGKINTVIIKNDIAGTILIHKIDALTKEPIQGVKFILYDRNMKPLGEYVSDNNGEVKLSHELANGKYFVREIVAAKGYILDNEVKTVNVIGGDVSTIEWENTPELGQIQILKVSSDYSNIKSNKINNWYI